MIKKKKKTAVKGTSSALIISIAIHVILFFVAGAFVAVNVMQRSETKFQGKQIVRPKMKIKKLQVPVKIEQKIRQQAPTLSNQQRVQATQVKTKSVDFKMPEMTGFGNGVAISGKGFEGSLGFATSQLNVFGLKSSAEKVVFILSTEPDMLTDDIGGIPAYTIIKQELIGLIGSLPPTTLFNVVVYDRGKAFAFSKELSTASDANVEKLQTWLSPLNASKDKYGLATLGFEGHPVSFEPLSPIFNRQLAWTAGFSYALANGAESIYWLTRNAYLWSMNLNQWTQCSRGIPLEKTTPPPAPTSSREWDYDEVGGEEGWKALVAEAKKKLEEDNAARLASGKPVRVIGYGPNDISLVQAYFPKSKLPIKTALAEPRAPAKEYSPADFMSYIQAMATKYAKKDRLAVSIGLKEKKISVNVVNFVSKDHSTSAKKSFVEILGESANGYKQIKGLAAIRSSARTQ